MNAVLRNYKKLQLHLSCVFNCGIDMQFEIG